uniref:B30.2/SPRY domain-containing protein n=1 Tax=Electrophorus electricus TaxID=8005 RepID=A0A4W4GHK8_ELEEL
MLSQIKCRLPSDDNRVCSLASCRAAKMMQCLQFLVEPAKNITVKFKESRQKAKNEKRELLDDNQQFIVCLAKDLSRVCQRSEVLEHIASSEDIWPSVTCRAVILEWASMLESKERPVQTDGWPEKGDWKELALSSEQNVESAKTLIFNWTKDLRAQPEQSVWPGEQVVAALEDLEKQWRRGHLATLQSAMELVFWALLLKELNKEYIPQQWLIWKQKSQKIGAIPYIPQSVWDWISKAAVEVTLDLDTANPDLLISDDEKRMRCGTDRQDVPNYHQRFDGWWCAVAADGFSSGRRYWEADVGEMDWRLGVAKESALRKGFKSLNTHTGYLTLRLERGSELKALTVPFTALPASLIPRRVAIHLDYDKGQLSFYNAESHAHIYTYNESFDEKLFPLFGTVEMAKDLIIRSPGDRSQCLCPGMCLWG